MKVGSVEIPDERLDAACGEICCLRCTGGAKPVTMDGLSLKLYRCGRCKVYWLEHHPNSLPESTDNLIGKLRHMEAQAKVRLAHVITRGLAREKAEKKEAADLAREQTEKAKQEVARVEHAKKQEARRGRMVQVL